MKKLTKKEKKYCISFVAFFVIALVVGIKSVYAYYYEEDNQTTNLFATAVGNIYEYIDKGQADIAIRVYKKLGNGSEIYVGQKEIPTNGQLNENLTKCYSTSVSAQDITCSKVDDTSLTSQNTGCHYSYSGNTIKIKSTTKAVCSFYFD